MHWQYVIPGYLVVFVTLALYSLYLVRRGRQLAERVPADKRRFLD